MSAVIGDPDVIAALRNPTPSSIVAFAGVTDDGAHENHAILRGQLGTVQGMPRHQQMPFHCEIAARYIPAIVTRVKQVDFPYGPAMLLLNTILYTPYFVRYSRFSGAKDLPKLQLSRMVNNIDFLNSSTSADEIGEVGQYLSTLIALIGTEGIDQADIEKLTPQFKTWKRRFPNRLAGSVGERCMMMLSNDDEAVMMGAGMRGQLGSCLDKCGSCSKSTREDGADLLQCSRCKTAVYCSTEHQRAHWKVHKPTCFPSAF